MIPSRGLRWSGQAIGIGRRRLEPFSARQFSSVQNIPIRSNPLLSRSSASRLRTNTRSQFSKTNTLIRNGAGIRFASTRPAAVAPAATTTDTASTASSSAASTPEITTTSLDNAFDFTSDSLYNIPEHIGYLKSLGLDYGWGPTAGMEWLLEHVHIYAGTPWWVSIAITAVIVRAVLFKAYVAASDNAAKMQAIKHISEPLRQQMTAAFKAGDQTRGMQLRQETKLVFQRADIKAWRSFVPMVQIFTGFGTFILLRGMANLPVPGLEHGGLLWFHNLTVPDPFLILPLATSAVLHWVLRRGGETGSTAMSPEAMKLVSYGLPLMSLLFTWWLPAAVQLSFFVSGLLSFGQASLFKMPAFRSYFGMVPLNMVPVASPGGTTPGGISPGGTTSGGTTPSPYQGKMRIRAPLSKAELDSAFQQGRKQSIVQKAKSSVLESTKDVRGAASTMISKGRVYAQDNAEKAEKKRREEYEKRRRAEIRAEELERRLAKAERKARQDE